MIRFLAICCIFFVLYLSFLAVSAFDVYTTFTFYDYIVETTLFTILAALALLLFVTIILFRLLSIIFNFPHLIKKRFAIRRMQKVNNILMQSMSYLLANNKFKAAEITRRIEKDLKVEHKELYNLIQAESEENFEKKIEYYRLLSNSKDYSYFAFKRLASTFLQNNFYEQAEDHATRAFNLNEFDSDILEILLHCYAKQGTWNKFVFIVSKLNRVDSKKMNQISSEISKYYLQAAKDTLEKGEDHQAMNYIESALKLNPSDAEALDFYLSLNLSLNHGSDSLEIIQNAFKVNPSFEIAEIYMKISNSQPEKMYDELSSMVDPLKYRGLFLAVAAYLGLPQKIESLSSPKLLTHYN